MDWSKRIGEIDVPPFHDANGVNGNLTAVHDGSELHDLTRRKPSIRNGRFENSTLKHWDTNFPEKILNAEVELRGHSIDLWNVRTVPGSICGEEKIKTLETSTAGSSRRAPDRESSRGTSTPPGPRRRTAT